jgi:hypothetical protein
VGASAGLENELLSDLIEEKSPLASDLHGDGETLMQIDALQDSGTGFELVRPQK